MKPTANYKMSSSLKASLAMSPLKDQHQQAAWKRAMIDAELSAAVRPQRERSNRGTQGN